jgi:hypothetical protein
MASMASMASMAALSALPRDFIDELQKMGEGQGRADLGGFFRVARLPCVV